MPKNNSFLKIFFPLLAISLTFTAYGQVATQADLEAEMRSYSKAAQELLNTNKNAPSYDMLQRYHKVQEVYFRNKRDSSLTNIRSGFVNASRERTKSITEREKKIAELKSVNDNIEEENLKMTRNTLMFFGILIGLVVLLLLNRFRALAKIKEAMVLSHSHLRVMENVLEYRGQNQEISDQYLDLNQSIKRNIEASSAILSPIITDKQNPLSKQVIKLQAGVDEAISVLDQSSTLIEANGKKLTDLNSLIEEVSDQSYYFMLSENPDFKCSVVKDLEKILPKVEVIPEEIRMVLFNLLINAFDAVRLKRTNAPKGYDPKVSITSRKLPRFVQIRVKDNGIGISEKDTTILFNSFYSSKNSDKNPGLGLPFSHEIITKNHKGELLIESDPGTGSDFIIRFPILSLM